MFDFLKKIKPTWMFSLESSSAGNKPTCFSLTVESLKPGELDSEYEDPRARKWDYGYASWQNGVMHVSDGERDVSHQVLNPYDEYRFGRKYFKKPWVWYYLFRRLLAFKNPVKEFAAFLRTVKVPYQGIGNNPKIYPDYDAFQSTMAMDEPLVSVIIPTLNRYPYLADVLRDLEKQDYKNFEVIVVDQSEPFQETFYSEFDLNMRVIYQREKQLWKARNRAIRESRGSFLLFFDDDSRVKPDWIFQHLKALEYFEADISAGVSLSAVGAPIPANYRFFRWADQFDSGNAMVKKSVFKKTGLFDRQFEKMRQGDGEFGMRAYMNGFRSVSNPRAARVHLKVSMGGLRAHGTWDGLRPKKLLAPRPVPSVLYFYRRYFKARDVINMLLISVPLSLTPYRLKGRKSAMLSSLFFSVLFLPVLLILVSRSWRISTKMLKEGPKVSQL
ncbi:MAG: glycosyl transferase family 2 [Acidobacteria bacterium]|nr:MAG: glycosyl transferase family 2 [Acidobacteriota bacterium]